MSATVRSAVAREREERAWRLRLNGMTERQIAAELGISQPSVHALLRRVEAQVLAEAKQFVLRYKARQLGRLESIHQEAVAAFQRSRADATKRTSEATPGEGQQAQPSQRITKLKVETHGRDGDPAWLGVALAAHDRIAALLGLNAPTKLAVQRDVDPHEQLSNAELLEAVRAEVEADLAKLAQRRLEE